MLISVKTARQRSISKQHVGQRSINRKTNSARNIMKTKAIVPLGRKVRMMEIKADMHASLLMKVVSIDVAFAPQVVTCN